MNCQVYVFYFFFLNKFFPNYKISCNNVSWPCEMLLNSRIGKKIKKNLTFRVSDR